MKPKKTKRQELTAQKEAIDKSMQTVCLLIGDLQDIHTNSAGNKALEILTMDLIKTTADIRNKLTRLM